MSDHGTYAMYQKHRKAGEPPCDPCVIANREYMRGYRRRTVDQPLVAAIRAEALTDAREAVAAAMTKRGGYHSASEFSAVVLAAIDGVKP
jgi:hypothetical protein